MSKILIFISLALLISLVSSQACLKLYDNPNLKGKNFQMCENGDVPNGWNDRVSSISVPKGYGATLYMDYGFGGDHITIGPGTWKADRTFNNQLSSLVIHRSGTGPLFFEDYDLQGKSFTK